MSASRATAALPHSGRKVIVIKNAAVIGSYDDDATAISETAKPHELGTFLVQKVEAGNRSYTQTFQSRVAFLAQ